MMEDLAYHCYWVKAISLVLLACFIIKRVYSRRPRNQSGGAAVRSVGLPAAAPSIWDSIPKLLPSYNKKKPEKPAPANMRYHRHPRFPKKPSQTLEEAPKPAKQPVDIFLVLDIEGTCDRGSDFDFPNEIIEFPVCLMRWKDKGEDSTASELEVVDEFRSFVRPTWRPTLSEFCTELTGITQEQVDSAPPFSEVLQEFQEFLIKHGLIDEHGQRLLRFCWCSDGPFDVRDFVVKQCFISKVHMPPWLHGDVLDIRTAVLEWMALQPGKNKRTQRPSRRTLNIVAQLKALGLSDFEGREHSGIDDARNIARIAASLAGKGVPLQPNTPIQPYKRWSWMGQRRGQILEDNIGT